MAILLTGAGGLFTRLGRLAKVQYDSHGYAGTPLPTNMNAAIAALGTEYGLASPLPAALTAAQSAVVQSPGSTIRAVAQSVLLKMVNDDQPQANLSSLGLALTELIRQMALAPASVATCTVSATATAASINSGDGVVVLTTKTGRGLIQQGVFAEAGLLNCTGDAQSATAPLGGEPWTYSGDAAVTDSLSHLWPGASGAQAGLTTCDSQARGLNLLANGGLDTYTTTDIPDNWALLSGAATTNYVKEVGTVHRGAASYKFIGGATAQSIAQTLAPSVVMPNRVYAYNLKVRASATPGAGNLVVKLIDGANAWITDDQAAANGSSTTLAGISTSTWTNVQGVVITPRVMPSVAKFSVACDTALGAGKNLFLDSVALCEMTSLYPGGPGLAVFAGLMPWIVNDRFTLTMTNDRAGAAYGATWQTYFDRFFGMRQLALQLPYTSGTPTILDSLITS
jgi:hypothetical protein